MELKEFIKATIKDILYAVKEAQDEIEIGQIIPHTKDTYQSLEAKISSYQVIEFEVNVVAEEKAGVESKISVVTGIIGGKAQGKIDSSSGNNNTIKFSIPIQFPRKNSE